MRNKLVKETVEFDTSGFMATIRTAVETLMLQNGEVESTLTYDASLRDIEKHTGVSASTLSRIDNGSIPDMQTFITIVQALELSAGDYFTRIRWQGERVD